MRSLPPQRGIDGSRFPVGPTPDDGEIFLPDLLLLHEQTETSRRRGIFCDQNKTAGFTIEPVNDGYLAAVGELKGEQLFQFAPERARVRWLCGMHEEKRRLVDNDNVLAFRDDPESGGVCARRFAGG